MVAGRRRQRPVSSSFLLPMPLRLDASFPIGEEQNFLFLERPNYLNLCWLGKRVPWLSRKLFAALVTRCLGRRRRGI
jgi:hypothetical protein